jgi:hypothetical protein
MVAAAALAAVADRKKRQFIPFPPVLTPMTLAQKKLTNGIEPIKACLICLQIRNYMERSSN